MLSRFLSSFSARVRNRHQHERWSARRANLAPKSVTSLHPNERAARQPLCSFDDLPQHPATAATATEQAPGPALTVQELMEFKLARDRDEAVRNAMRCDVCNRKLPNFHSLLVHVHNKPELRPFECKYCLMDFPSRIALHQHLEFHTGRKPIACDVCGKALLKYNTFLRHMRRRHR